MLLTYNLVPYQITQVCMALKDEYLLYRLSFNGSLAKIMRLLIGLLYSTPDVIRRQLKYFYTMAKNLILDPKRKGDLSD